ncbi:MAG: cell envelope integrity protein CreD [Thiobacillus sp.]|nr:cell envelope integrity protein CreD [Thiobacillus sp.]
MNRNLTYKLLALAVMAIVLIVALTRIEWKVQERQATRDAAVASIASQYAESQQFSGPMLWLQCSETRAITQFNAERQPQITQEIVDCSRLIRPKQLTGKGDLAVSERYRGIYKARLYLASLRMGATFEPVDVELGANQTLKSAAWVFGVSDPRGLKRISIRGPQGKVLQAIPGTTGSSIARGFHVPIPLENIHQPQSLTADIELAGNGRFDWVPIAEDNDFQLHSVWPHPSFSGQYLPETRDITDKGFSAHWRINAFATDGDNVLETGPNATGNTTNWYTHSLGVSLVDPVDAYVQSDRAIRYGFLFILLTLGGFFLFELLKQKTLHPLQYLLIGFATVVFFLLLLAVSEHTGFLVAYLAAATACTLMIAAYGRTLLGSWRGSGVLGLGYGGLFAGLYQLLASEDHALLMGACLTFIVLAATMYLTRKLNWADLGRQAPSSALAGQPE